MNWEAIGAIGEVLGATGVIVTLIYLSQQIRQNSHLVQASTRQAISTAQAEIGFRLAENPGSLIAVAELLGLEGDEATISNLRREMLVRGILRQFENQFHQSRAGTFDAEMWEAYRTHIRNNFASQQWRDIWQRYRPIFSASFVAFLDDEIRQLDARRRS